MVTIIIQIKNNYIKNISLLFFRYKQCYEEVMNGIDESLIREKGAARDDRIHGSLLVLNELLRVSNIHWERQNDLLMQRLQWDQSQTSAVRSFVLIILVF